MNIRPGRLFGVRGRAG